LKIRVRENGKIEKGRRKQTLKSCAGFYRGLEVGVIVPLVFIVTENAEH